MLSIKDQFFEVRPTGIPLSKGKLLLSAPFIADGYFDRTVILLVEYGEEGAMGLILNRPIHVYMKDVLPGLPECGFPVYNGGPVALNQLFFLHNYEQLSDGAVPVGGGCFFGGSGEEVCSLLKVNLLEEERIRFFVGYAGWSSGQRERELEERSWLVADPPEEGLLLSDDRLWRQVVCRLGDQYRVWLEVPDKAYYN